jgi:probable rRNA maturation factor
MKSGPEVLIEESAWSGVSPDLVGRIKSAARLSLSRAPLADGKPFVLTIVLSGDAHLCELNKRHRGKDKPTNVLSFPSSADDYLGDIAIAFGVCEREAKLTGKPLADHTVHLAVHGVLHLLGYDHEVIRDAEMMESLETEILAELGIPDPYRARDCAG